MGEYIAELQLPHALDVRGVALLARQACLELYRVEWVRAWLASDGSRMLCWYRAADAESVRLVLRQQGTPAAWVVPVVGIGGASVEAAEYTVLALDPALEKGTDAPGDNTTALLEVLAAAGCVPRQSFRAIGGNHLVCLVVSADVGSVETALAAQGLATPAPWACHELDPGGTELLAAFAPPAADPVAVAPHPAVSAGTVADEPLGPGITPRPPAQGAFDAIVIGAGPSGLCMLERLLRAGWRVLALERGADVGGVWFWNRYPGARVDSESYTYGYSSPAELLRDWRWRELFAAQPEVLGYFRHVADRCQLRPHIRFNTSVTAACFEAASGQWCVATETGETLRATFLIAATGTLTEPQWPDYPGLDGFLGQRVHTARWPQSGIDLAGRRVGVIGTGASAVQLIPTIAPRVRELTVFQRTPTYCIPQRNRALTAADHSATLRDWDQILSACRNSYGGFIHCFDPRPGLAIPRREREQKFEALWQQSGFAFWFANFGDLMMNLEVNAHACEFVRGKIRARVRDPETARKLLPDHPFGAKRVPLENGYYEVYNQPNVSLVDLRETPIECVTPRGVLTSRREHVFDVLVCATGFDAGTGALTRIQIVGADGMALAAHWGQGPRTFLGLLVSGFPNLFIVNGPQNAAGLCNAGRCIEQNVDWIARCLDFMVRQGYNRIEASPDAELAWSVHVEDTAEATVLSSMRNSWFFGANTPGKPRRVNIYAAGAREYREHCEAVAGAGYSGLVMS